MYKGEHDPNLNFLQTNLGNMKMNNDNKAFKFKLYEVKSTGEKYITTKFFEASNSSNLNLA